MLDGITIICFAGSYALALALELARAMKRNRWLNVGAMGFLSLGLLLQSYFLAVIARQEMGSSLLFSNWHDWCLLAAWVLAAACLGLSLRRVPLIGIFMLPLVLLFLGAAWMLQGAPAFAQSEALFYWRMIHGVTLLIGTVAVMIGFVAGLMFLLQSYRLKHKLPPSSTFKLPSLEWLLRLNEETLVISSFLLAIGLLTGIVINAIAHAQDTRTIEWSEPTVLGSAALFLWLVFTLLFNWLYKPARQGRKVAYLTMASFGFLAIVLGLVLFSGHASGGNANAELTHDGLPRPSFSASGRLASSWRAAP